MIFYFFNISYLSTHLFTNHHFCSASPDKPAMTQIPTEVDAGTIVMVSCSVTHTCSSHPPEFSWSVSTLTSEATHTVLPQGVWKSTSTITFMAEGGDGEKSLTCTATYWLGRKHSATGQLTVKGQWMQFCLWGCHIFSLFILFTAYVNRITGFPVKKVSPSNNPCLNPTPNCYRSWSDHL